jgi:hypothetical protein
MLESNTPEVTPANPVPNPNPLRPAKKISAVEAVDAICGVVRDRLMKQDVFRRSNASYIGINFRYALKFDLFSLGEQGLELTGDATAGETPKHGKKVSGEDVGHMVAGKVTKKSMTASTETIAVRNSVSETAGN